MITDFEVSDSPSLPTNTPDKKMAIKLAKQALELSKNTNPPVSINEVVKALQRFSHKIVVRSLPLSDGFSGQIVQMPEITGIMYNSNHSQHRQRYTVAHELGHFMMNHTLSATYKEIINLKNKLKIEKEANIFAAELLMPKDLIKKTLKERKCNVKDLATLFDVSEEAMWFKLESDSLISKL